MEDNSSKNNSRIDYTSNNTAQQDAVQSQKQNLHTILVEQEGIRTYQKDSKTALSGEQGALVKETIQKERNKEQLISSQTLNTIKNRVFLIVSLLFLVATIAISLYAYTIHKKNTLVIVETKQNIPIISFENELPHISLPKTKELLVSYIQENTSKLKQEENSTLRFTFGDTEKINTQTSDFLSLLNEKEKNTWETLPLGNFEVGLVYKNNNPSKFILINTDGSDVIYKKFSVWEETLLSDVSTLFDIDESVLNNKKLSWENTLYENIDFKTYTDDTGKILLIKGFLNAQVFVITDNPDSIIYLLSLIRLEHRRSLVE